MARQMKDSGMEWVGQIPEAWKLEKLKHCVVEINEKNNPVKFTNVLSLTKEKGVLPYEDKGNQGNKSKEDITQYKIAYKNTIVANSMNIIIGSVGISNYDGCVSPVYYVFKNTENSDLRFINYLLTTTEFQKQMRRFANGILEIRLRISSENLMGQKIPMPSLQEQQKIADFLDEKVREIDKVIETTKATIEDYKKYKQSLITEAVTKGLNPDVEMKDSGIEWIGEIPSEWKIKKLKNSCVVRNEKYEEKYGQLDYFGLENIVSQSGKYIETDSQYDLQQSCICKKDDIVFGKLRPYLAKVYKVPYDRCCSSEFAIFYKFDGIANFYKYLFLSYGFIDTVNASTYGTKMPRANIEFIKNMYIPVPTETEQQEIANYLDEKCTEIDNLISAKEQLIADMENYKKSLIYEYVTGKKEVE